MKTRNSLIGVALVALMLFAHWSHWQSDRKMKAMESRLGDRISAMKQGRDPGAQRWYGPGGGLLDFIDKQARNAHRGK